MWKLAEDTLDAQDFAALAAWIATCPQVTQGPLVRQFEQAWARWVGVPHAVMMTSGTTANFALIACAAQRVGRRPLRVGVSAVTWSTNLSPSLLMGHEVTVFDVAPGTLGVDPAAACEAMGRGELDVLFVTHLLGFNSLTQEMLEVAAKHGVLLIEDCCEAHGAHLGGRKVGSLGLAGTFSFYFGHHMSTIEGGMVTTADAELADALRLMRAHGLARESVQYDAYAAQYPEVDRRFLFVSAGLNFRATEINAFLGLRQLERLDARIAQRNANLTQLLKNLPEALWRDFATEGASSFALPLIAKNRDDAQRLRAVVDASGIESRPVVAGNILRQPMLRGYSVHAAPGGTPTADWVHQHGMYIGNGHHVTEAKVAAFCAALTAGFPSGY